MEDTLHIIVAGEEGQAKSFAVPKPLLKIAALVFFSLLTILFFMSAAGVELFFSAAELENRVAGLDDDFKNSVSTNLELKEQVQRLEQEKEALIKNAVGELNEKSRLIESVLSTVGVGVKIQESKDNSGGPYNALSDRIPEDLIFMADRYLETIQSIPLGVPAPGVITSKFGRRQDPINKQAGFHDGVDIRGKYGSEIKATAEGLVYEQGYDQGYGWFVIMDHDLGFRTMVGHMKKILVKKGERVQRGQVVGLLGNSGRSTGPHVHYEIRHFGRLVDPIKFMRVAQYLVAGKNIKVNNRILLAPRKSKMKKIDSAQENQKNAQGING